MSIKNMSINEYKKYNDYIEYKIEKNSFHFITKENW